MSHQRTAPAEGPETVVGHVVAGGDVHLLQLVAVPGQAVAGVVSQAGAGAELQLVDVGAVPGKYEESVVTHSLNTSTSHYCSLLLVIYFNIKNFLQNFTVGLSNFDN